MKLLIRFLIMGLVGIGLAFPLWKGIVHPLLCRGIEGSSTKVANYALALGSFFVTCFLSAAGLIVVVFAAALIYRALFLRRGGCPSCQNRPAYLPSPADIATL